MGKKWDITPGTFTGEFIILFINNKPDRPWLVSSAFSCFGLLDKTCFSYVLFCYLRVSICLFFSNFFFLSLLRQSFVVTFLLLGKNGSFF